MSAVDFLRYEEPGGENAVDRLVLHHVAQNRLIYVALAALLMVPALAEDMVSASIYICVLVVLLLFVVPTFPNRFAERMQRVLRVAGVSLLVTPTLFYTALAFLDIFDRRDGQRLPHLVDKLSSLLARESKDPDVLLNATDHWFFLVLCMCVFVVLMLASATKWPRSKIAFQTLTVAVGCMVIDIPAAAVRLLHNSGLFLDALGPALEGGAFVAALAAWSVAVLAIVARRTKIERRPVVEEAPTSEYTKAASAAATAALVVIFFSVNACWGYIRDLDGFFSVRKGILSDYVSEMVDKSPELKAALAKTQAIENPGERIAKQTTLLKGGLEGKWLATPPPWMEWLKITNVTGRPGGMLEDYKTGVLVEAAVKEVDLASPWVADATLNFPEDLRIRHTYAAGGGCADTLDERSSTDQVYRSCEKSVVKRGVKFPLIDTEFPVTYVVVVAFFSCSGAIVYLLDRLGALLKLPRTSKVEPWILMDASTRAGGMLARGWIAMLSSGLWLLTGAATAITAMRVRVEGSHSTPASDVLIAFCLIVAVIVSAGLSTSLLRSFSALRLLQSEERKEDVTAILATDSGGGGIGDTGAL